MKQKFQIVIENLNVPMAPITNTDCVNNITVDKITLSAEIECSEETMLKLMPAAQEMTMAYVKMLEKLSTGF